MKRQLAAALFCLTEISASATTFAFSTPESEERFHAVIIEQGATANEAAARLKVKLDDLRPLASCEGKGWYSVLSVEQYEGGNGFRSTQGAGSCGHKTREEAELAAFASCNSKPRCRALLYTKDTRYLERDGILLYGVFKIRSRYDDGVAPKATEDVTSRISNFGLKDGGPELALEQHPTDRQPDVRVTRLSWSGFLSKFRLPAE